MKLATYNIYNSTSGMPQRKQRMIETIKKVDADVIALQEVRNKSFFDEVASALDYSYSVFNEHTRVVVAQEPDRKEEGLAILSKYPIVEVEVLDYMNIVTIKHHDQMIAIANVHLPWHSVMAQEKCILTLNKQLVSMDTNYQFVMGDFNCDEQSSVHQFLKGQRSLHDQEVKHYWTDLAFVAKEFLAIPLKATIDLKHNPRWKNQPIVSNSARVDCIFMHDCFPSEYPSLQGFTHFGEEVYENKYCSSDHYGVCATLLMPYESNVQQI